MGKAWLEKPWLQLILRLLEALVISGTAFLVLERCNMGGLWSMLAWIYHNPRLFAVNFALAFALYLLLRCFFRRPLLPAAIYLTLLGGLATINYYKLILRSDPLIPMDIFNLGVAAEIAPNMNITLNADVIQNILLLLLCLALVWAYQRYLYRPLFSGGWRRWLGTVGSAFCCLFFLGHFLDLDVLTAQGAVDVRYNQYTNYRTNGFLVSTMMNLTHIDVTEPENYSRKTVEEAAAAVRRWSLPGALGRPEKMPHILVVQMEAYGDPRRLCPDIVYETDPFSPLEPYQGELRSFYTLPSIIGGGTANSEYEFLTGYNMIFCPPGVTPFLTYVNQPKPSLVKDLTALGYRNFALHPNTGSFYGRDMVYPNLGFEEFYTLEDFDNPAYQGYYVTDECFKDKLLEVFEEKRKEADGPVFAYGVSIANHGPFSYPECYREYPFSITGSLILDEVQKRELSTYGANMYDSNQMLAELIEALSQVEEPVLLLVYGDHQAAWTWTSQLESTPELLRERYATESFFWANYEIAEPETPIISASGLGAWLLRYADLPMTTYFKGIQMQFAHRMAYNLAVTVDLAGVTAYSDRKALEPLKLLPYDRMFGEDYIDQEKD